MLLEGSVQLKLRELWSNCGCVPSISFLKDLRLAPGSLKLTVFCRATSSLVKVISAFKDTVLL